MPGLRNELDLLGRKYRSDDPFIEVVTLAPRSDAVRSSGIQIKVVPRSFWEENPAFIDSWPEEHREILRLRFGDPPPRRPDFAVAFTFTYSDKPGRTVQSTTKLNGDTIRAAEIVEALTARTRVEDLADAFAWFESSSHEHAISLDSTLHYCNAPSVEELLLAVRVRTGSVGARDCVPVTTRASNNDLACLMMGCLGIEFEIRLTELRSAAHLNGREGIVRGQDSNDFERWNVRLDDGTLIRVKGANFVHIPRGVYKRISP